LILFFEELFTSLLLSFEELDNAKAFNVSKERASNKKIASFTTFLMVLPPIYGVKISFD
jgi:hypothetical protein